MYKFDVEKVTEEAIQWIRNYVNGINNKMSVVIGMSGGKDSTITAALLVKALGAERVIGVALPQGEQSINDADKICEYLGMKYMCINIGDVCKAFESAMFTVTDFITGDTILNIPPRVRMTTLYAVAQSTIGGALVVNTCNYDEDFIGYATKFGDSVGDFSVFANLTVTEILAIGDYLGLPSQWVHKTPDDGLPGSMADESKFGFSYNELSSYLRENIIPDGYCHEDTNDLLKIDKIKKMHNANLHKMLPMPKFLPSDMTEPTWYKI